VQALLSADVVLVPYSVLQQEVHYSPSGESMELRNKKRYEVPESPLLQVGRWVDSVLHACSAACMFCCMRVLLHACSAACMGCCMHGLLHAWAAACIHVLPHAFMHGWTLGDRLT
jgi:hypothetical protein